MTEVGLGLLACFGLMLGYCVEKMWLTVHCLLANSYKRGKRRVREKIDCSYSSQQLGAHTERREDGVTVGATANNKIIAE